MDSGVGGLSVFREIRKLLPGEHFIYYSDNAHCPYGEKTPEYIRARLDAITTLFLSRGADAMVLACNTATAAGVEYLRGKYSIPFIGMEPAVKPAALGTESKVIGVLATAGTLKVSKYLNTKGRFEDQVTIVEQVGKGFVELVEKGLLTGPEAEAVVTESLEPLLDTLRKVAAELGRPEVQFIDPAPAVATRLIQVMEQAGIPKEDKHPQTELLSSGDKAALLRTFSLI